MKHMIARHFSAQWLKDAQPKSKRWTFKVIYLAKSDYVEISKSIKANWTELLYILKNELAMHQLQYEKVLWRIQRKPDHTFRLQFVCISQQALQAYQGQFVLLYPETWLAKQCLQPEQLYLIDSSDKYWAYVAADGTAHFTDKKGLMVNPEHFLSAIGATDDKAETSAQVLNIKQVTLEQPILPKWYDWAGMLYYRAPARQFSVTGWKPYLLLGLTLSVIYAVVLSAGLALYRDHLKEDVAQRQQDAEVVLLQRQKTEDLVALVSRYTPLLEGSAKYSNLLMFLSEQLPAGTELRRSQLNENVAVIQGIAPSATEVLAQLGNSPLITEARFDRPVQAERDAESFTISFIFNSLEVKDAGN
ncbi:PilN domain-containing protein [Rheinheimera baltica]|uniref:PilN domain-containing protein n=1 Tax=Rheinheimera baltica TaxID=67576 RepID=UPI00273E5BEA|nr:PilN domain-containing protein [Rheinheimera baltica]MDP5143107.1 PilN domain-containing protein [Rheinheimera baltica]